MLKVFNLNKYFNDEDQIKLCIKDISIDFPQKGLVTILGASGSGKPPFLMLSVDLIKPIVV